MKPYLVSIALLVTVASNFAAIAEQRQAHQHDHTANQPQIALNHGEKWKIDDSLHTGMTLIKQKITQNLDDINKENFSEQRYAHLAIELDKQLVYLFKNCQLSPQADAQLHILLAKIARGVEIIKQSDNKKLGTVSVIQALIEYPQFFDDSAWQNVEH